MDDQTLLQWAKSLLRVPTLAANYENFCNQQDGAPAESFILWVSPHNYLIHQGSIPAQDIFILMSTGIPPKTSLEAALGELSTEAKKEAALEAAALEWRKSQ